MNNKVNDEAAHNIDKKERILRAKKKRKRIKRIYRILLAAGLCLLVLDGVGAYKTFTRSGLEKTKDGYVYLEKGRRVRNCWYEADGKKYYFGDDGIAYTGTKDIAGHRYYFRYDGALADGWAVEALDDIYCTDKDGIVLTGKHTIDGIDRYFESDGELVTGWIQLSDGRRMYADENGVILKGKHRIGIHTYIFDDDGIGIGGWHTDENGNAYYCLDSGMLAKDALTVDGKMYLFDENGILLRNGWHKDSHGRGYYLDADGIIKTGWIVYEDGSVGYAAPDGVLYYDGFYEIDDNYYKFTDGRIETGWITLEDGGRGFALADGTICFNTTASDGEKLYYFNEEGHTLSGMITMANGRKALVNEDGSVQTGWITLEDGSQAFAGSDGALYTGQHSMDGYIYEFDNNGVYVKKYEPSSAGKQISLTFDDGPSIYTNSILDVLEQYNVKATFFVIGERAEKYQDEIRREFNTGCEVAQHTQHHTYLTFVSLEEAKKEIDDADNVLLNIIGQKAALFRPPGGKYNADILQLINRPVMKWSIDTRDWQSRDTASVIQKATTGIQDGDIILMHDIYSSTAEAVKTIVPELQAQGFEMVTVSQLANSHGGAEDNVVYKSFKGQR